MAMWEGRLSEFEKDRIKQSNLLRVDLIKNPFAWPGGYPKYALMTDGGALCVTCCEKEKESIEGTCCTDGWMISALVVNWEDDELTCDHCNKSIDPAYQKEVEA